MNYIKVSTQSLNQDRSAIQSEIKGISRAVQELAEEILQLGQTWEGPAWQTFQNQAAADIEHMKMIYEKLSAYISHMEFAGKEYQKCENQINNLVDSIRI